MQGPQDPGSRPASAPVCGPGRCWARRSKTEPRALSSAACVWQREEFVRPVEWPERRLHHSPDSPASSLRRRPHRRAACVLPTQGPGSPQPQVAACPSPRVPRTQRVNGGGDVRALSAPRASAALARYRGCRKPRVHPHDQGCRRPYSLLASFCGLADRPEGGRTQCLHQRPRIAGWRGPCHQGHPNPRGGGRPRIGPLRHAQPPRPQGWKWSHEGRGGAGYDEA